jgi:hypothetical protein
LRWGVTLDVSDKSWSEVVQSGVSLLWESYVRWDGGNAEDCGAGGVELEAVAEDMV